MYTGPLQKRDNDGHQRRRVTASHAQDFELNTAFREASYRMHNLEQVTLEWFAVTQPHKKAKAMYLLKHLYHIPVIDERICTAGKEEGNSNVSQS